MWPFPGRPLDNRGLPEGLSFLSPEKQAEQMAALVLADFTTGKKGVPSSPKFCRENVFSLPGTKGSSLLPPSDDSPDLLGLGSDVQEMVQKPRDSPASPGNRS